MDTALQWSFSDAERNFASSLLDGEGADVTAAVENVFTTLDDPLLSADDVVALLRAVGRRDEIVEALGALVEKDFLETSETTQRPFDKEGVRLYRKGGVVPTTLQLLAVESQQGSDDRRYQLSLNGRLIRSIARVDRLDALNDEGNQRQEIRKHVEKIAAGIRSGTQIPSSVLLVILSDATLALDDDLDEEDDDAPKSFVRIRPFDESGEWFDVVHDEQIVQHMRLVLIEIPYRKAAFDDEKSMLLVDGQQRTAALSLVSVDDQPHVSVAANAVVADAEQAKRVFQVANDTVKISADFSRALLASMTEPPGYLSIEKVKADTAKALALIDAGSPFLGRVKHPGVKPAKQPIAYNSLFAVVGEFTDNLPDDVLGKSWTWARLIAECYTIVAEVWPNAWDAPPSESKLTHGAGLRAVAALSVIKMRELLLNGSLDDAETWKSFRGSFERLRDQSVAWTVTDATAASKTILANYKSHIMTSQNTAQDIKELSVWIGKEMMDLDFKAKKQHGPKKP